RLVWRFAMRLVTKPSRQFLIAGPAMRLDPSPLFADRFPFGPKQAEPRKQSRVEARAVPKNQQIARRHRNQQAQIQTHRDILRAHEKPVLDRMPINLIRQLLEALRSPSS